ncbi:MAG: hypothetical protein BWY74_04003 [Firmicutes bacterium ADurb.Bin419]|nr:MAG: hypothetical protein BWY74_04003 [Firmicutes bacterium ADurb.Bin419]
MKKRLITGVLAIVMLLSFTACGNDKTTTPDATARITTSMPAKNSDDLIYGKWAADAENGPMFEFSNDGRYVYYTDKNSTSDNFYKGSVTILSSVKALSDLKITTQDYLDKYDNYAGGYYNVFSVKMKHETYQSEGADKSDTLNKEESLDYMFMLSKDSDDKATIINMKDSTSTELTRVTQ